MECVQIGLKPLIRDGLNTCIILALRDVRHNRFSDSLLVVETSLCNSLVCFNCYSNFEVSLTDRHLLDVFNT